MGRVSARSGRAAGAPRRRRARGRAAGLAARPAGSAASPECRRAARRRARSGVGSEPPTCTTCVRARAPAHPPAQHARHAHQRPLAPPRPPRPHWSRRSYSRGRQGNRRQRGAPKFQTVKFPFGYAIKTQGMSRKIRDILTRPWFNLNALAYTQSFFCFMRGAGWQPTPRARRHTGGGPHRGRGSGQARLPLPRRRRRPRGARASASLPVALAAPRRARPPGRTAARDGRCMRRVGHPVVARERSRRAQAAGAHHCACPSAPAPRASGVGARALLVCACAHTERTGARRWRARMRARACRRECSSAQAGRCGATRSLCTARCPSCIGLAAFSRRSPPSS